MSNQPPFGDPPPPGGWGTPPGGQQTPGGWNPQGGPAEPFPPQGQPGYGPPPGYGGGPPPGYGQPPGYGEAPPPGYGGYQSPSKSKAPLIVGIIAGVLILGGAIGAFVLLSGGDDDPVAIATATPQATASVQPTEAPTAEATPTATATATPQPRPTSTMPEAPPEPDPLPTATPDAPPPSPAVPGSSMDMGDGVQGEITNAALVQEFFFDGLTGEEIVLTMTALDDSLDPVLTLFAPDGVELERNDDDFDLPNSTDSRIRLQLPADGEYRVEASSFASTTGRFELTLEFPSVLSATDTLSASVPEIVYDYQGTAGEVVVINMRALDDEVDPLVYVLDPQGTEIGRDDDGGSFPNSRLELTLPSDGTYTIVASTFGQRYGQFELTLSTL
ncbi:MAG TPA: hypothetical protein VMM13_06455 [Euzebya sp.]|nr:hypothetical protein [Euzebya sp.]